MDITHPKVVAINRKLLFRIAGLFVHLSKTFSFPLVPPSLQGGLLKQQKQLGGNLKTPSRTAVNTCF